MKKILRRALDTLETISKIRATVTKNTPTHPHPRALTQSPDLHTVNASDFKSDGGTDGGFMLVFFKIQGLIYYFHSTLVKYINPKNNL